MSARLLSSLELPPGDSGAPGQLPVADLLIAALQVTSEDVNSSIKTFFCPNETYNDMATLFFNPQESAILQLFHQDGECVLRPCQGQACPSLRMGAGLPICAASPDSPGARRGPGWG